MLSRHNGDVSPVDGPVGRWRVASLIATTFLGATGCGASGWVRIVNDTAKTVVLHSCAQEPDMNYRISPHGHFDLSDYEGRRVLSDDPGFACTIEGPHGLVCLRIPTDQSRVSIFRVSAAKPTPSDAECFRDSDPHI